MDIDRLLDEASFFRKAIEWYQKTYPEEVLVSDPSRVHSKFPNDCCKSASFMLSHYLRINGFDGLKYVWGYHDKDAHGWLAVDGIIVDITADQFKGEDRPLIVLPSDNINFHESITSKEEYPCHPTSTHKRKANDIVSQFEASATA